MSRSEQNHNLYMNRKESGVCIRCGKPTDDEHSRCKECMDYASEYQRKTREWCKENHICVICHKQVVYENEITCPDCRAKNIIRVRKYDEKYGSEKRKERNKNRYANLKSKGLCVVCGYRKAVDGKTKCRICQDYYNAYRRLKRNEVKSDVRV